MIARLFRWLVTALTAMLLLSVLWVLLYRWVDPPITILMAQESRSHALRHTVLRADDLPRVLKHAVIAAEDSNFCSHHGFDVEAIQKAIEQNARGRKLRGGSTISQQTAKNVFLWPARSWLRKGLEAYFTVLIELLWPKSRIMTVYLNIAEWGPGIFGAEAAARHHFGKSARNLTRTEAARLAAILPSPKKWSASRPGPFVTRKSKRIARAVNTVEAELAGCL